jgi:hypothetical protein
LELFTTALYSHRSEKLGHNSKTVAIVYLLDFIDFGVLWSVAKLAIETPVFQHLQAAKSAF